MFYSVPSPEIGDSNFLNCFNQICEKWELPTPTTYVVRGKVMFSQVSVILFRGKEGWSTAWTEPSPQDQGLLTPPPNHDLAPDGELLTFLFQVRLV